MLHRRGLMPMQMESYFCNPRREILTFLPTHYEKVLEVGCGAGAFHADLNSGIEYWGVDPSESAQRVMSGRVHRFLLGFLEDVASDLPDNYFDLIVINDVMEHTPNHETFLLKLKAKLTAGGSLVGSVPNVRYVLNLKELLLQKDWAYQASGGVLDETHLRFFTQKSLIRSLNRAGFVVEQCEGINAIWWSRHRARMVVKRVFYGAVGVFLGRDVPYLQFAFRCKV